MTFTAAPSRNTQRLTSGRVIAIAGSFGALTSLGAGAHHSWLTWLLTSELGAAVRVTIRPGFWIALVSFALIGIGAVRSAMEHNLVRPTRVEQPLAS